MTLKEFLEFTFQGVGHFIGMFIILSLISSTIIVVVDDIVSLFKKK